MPEPSHVVIVIGTIIVVMAIAPKTLKGHILPPPSSRQLRHKPRLVVVIAIIIAVIFFYSSDLISFESDFNMNLAFLRVPT